MIRYTVCVYLYMYSVYCIYRYDDDDDGLSLSLSLLHIGVTLIVSMATLLLVLLPWCVFHKRGEGGLSMPQHLLTQHAQLPLQCVQLLRLWTLNWTWSRVWCHVPGQSWVKMMKMATTFRSFYIVLSCYFLGQWTHHGPSWPTLLPPILCLFVFAGSAAQHKHGQHCGFLWPAGPPGGSAPEGEFPPEEGAGGQLQPSVQTGDRDDGGEGELLDHRMLRGRGLATVLKKCLLLMSYRRRWSSCRVNWIRRQEPWCLLGGATFCSSSKVSIS